MDIIQNDFKTIQIVCYNSAIDTKASRVYRYMLSKLLVSHTTKYPTKLDMSIRLEALYGALLSAKTELNGNINTLGITLTIADPKIVKDEQLLAEAIALFKGVLYDHDSFDANIFEDEKRQLIEQWQSIKDNKAAYANHKFNELFRLPDISGFPLTGTLAQIKKATPEGLFDYYKNVFLKEDIHLIVNGNIEAFDEYQILTKDFPKKELPFQTTFRKTHPLKTVTETTDMNQAIIKFGYVFPIYRFDDAYAAALLANFIIGGYPESRLFKIIREEMALCYDISSSYDVYKGTLIISSGVGIPTLDKAKQAIIQLVDQSIQEGITADELNTVKGYVIHQLKSGLDHQSYFTKRAYYRYITHINETIEMRIESIKNVDTSDVNDVIKTLKLDTIYVLKGDVS